MKSHVEEDVLQCTRTAAALRDQLCYMVPYRGRRIGCWTVPATIDETSTASFLCLSPISPLSTFPPPPPPPPLFVLLLLSPQVRPPALQSTASQEVHKRTTKTVLCWRKDSTVLDH